jgi:peptidoglycan/xylan/chitin deacetylase (PgdA/CDA1 family)
MLVRSAATLAALALPRVASAQEPGRARRIAVTIDDGPATGTGRDLETFLRIASGLREAFVAEKVPAIMFINERQLHVEGERDRRIETVQQWLDAGLDLGNHTYSHPRLENMEVWQYTDDILKGEVVSRPLLEARGKKLVWFRYPFLETGRGDTARAIEEFLSRRGYRIAPVSVDYSDYSFAGAYSRFLRTGAKEKADELFASMMNRLDESFTRAEQRSMEVLGYELPQTLLIHCNEMNSLMLRATIQRIRQRGYQFVSLDEAMKDPAYNLPNMKPGAMGGGGFFNSIAAAKREAAQKQ